MKQELQSSTLYKDSTKITTDQWNCEYGSKNLNNISANRIQEPIIKINIMTNWYSFQKYKDGLILGNLIKFTMFVSLSRKSYDYFHGC